MSTLLRSRLAVRATPAVRPVVYPRGRFYAHSSYGGEGETDPQQPNNPRNTPTRDIEHPGPPPPDTSSSTPTGNKARPEPSNKAHPTLADGDASPYTDRDGNTTRDAPEDVKQHNEELSKRYDHPRAHA
ncbi:hypothetical protein BO78DRAFT_419215 [Aspergillus sclerotiicarbonarius CBS 121057]|uniref:Uncharacterized protein n=1 Tax=Aspergillus sclerotiicarbonarius (strain CBS 121057 / IBT 28362) TaxID=1448318 RepID=A0A319E712_ASPSB|nr:hypothetical protein BO78DRAFT_419215 [Aspergillus sclerotiicarbonarius CBS 121057]